MGAAMAARRRRETPPGARLSIGALSRATGIPVETLRTWEARYGFPVPERRPSGHRVYAVALVPRLRRVAEALARGHRAGQVLTASEADLQELLAAGTPSPGPEAATAVPADGLELLRLVAGFDAARLTRALLTQAARLGPLEFLETVVAPLVREVGEAWAQGRLGVRHEHFVSERVGDLLRSLRLPLEERATGPLVVFATLPGEPHGLGLQMAALATAFAGCRVLYLGTETPPADMVTLTRDFAARALALSVSAARRSTATTAQVRRLRAALPRRTTLLLGGEGAPAPRAGVEVFADLRRLDAWARAAAAGGSAPARQG
jgi:methanogenic corrinoid protein MtbC1